MFIDHTSILVNIGFRFNPEVVEQINRAFYERAAAQSNSMSAVLVPQQPPVQPNLPERGSVSQSNLPTQNQEGLYL